MIDRSGQDKAFLVVEHTGQHIPITEQRTTIGRGPGNSIELDDNVASRQHAAIVLQDGRYGVQDLDSANGTFVNGRRIKGWQVLGNQDKIRVGQTVLEVRLGAPAAAPGRRGPRPAGVISEAATQAVPSEVPPARARAWAPAVTALLAVALVVAIAVILFLALRQDSPETLVIVRMTATPPPGTTSQVEPTATLALPTAEIRGTEPSVPPPADTPLPSPQPAETLPPPADTSAPPSDTPPPTTTPTITLPPPSATPRPPTPRAQGEPGVIADFETFGAWKRGNEPNGTFTQTQEQVHGGAYAGKLAYNLPTTGNDYVVFVQTHNLSGSPNQVSAWVYGDGSGHFVNVWMRDAGGETWQFPLGQVRHTGWQQMTGWLDTGAPWPVAHIDGAANGALDYPVAFRALVLDDVPDSFSGSGTIYIDDLRADQSSQPVPTQVPTATQPPGRVVRFWADDTSLTAGSSTVLHWHVENVRAIYLDGAPVTGPDGQKTVSPAVTTTYRLRVVYAGGEDIYEVTITVS